MGASTASGCQTNGICLTLACSGVKLNLTCAWRGLGQLAEVLLSHNDHKDQL